MKQKKCAVVNRELCVACGSCQKVCPMGAIRVYKGLYAITDGARWIVSSIFRKFVFHSAAGSYPASV